MGVMGIDFVVSLYSGVVLCALIMRRLPFAAPRTDKGKRLARLDQHNLVAMVHWAGCWWSADRRDQPLRRPADRKLAERRGGANDPRLRGSAAAEPKGLRLARNRDGLGAAGAARPQPAVHRLARQGVEQPAPYAIFFPVSRPGANATVGMRSWLMPRRPSSYLWKA